MEVRPPLLASRGSQITFWAARLEFQDGHRAPGTQAYHATTRLLWAFRAAHQARLLRRVRSFGRRLFAFLAVARGCAERFLRDWACFVLGPGSLLEQGLLFQMGLLGL